MSSTSPNQKVVLISGVNGYLASRTAEALLNAGYHVRGTVRSRSSADGLLKALETFANAGKLTVVEVPDITVPGAFDEAVKGVHAIAHIASPLSSSFTDPDPVIHAAVQGTLSILNSALTHGLPTLKSFILMSSIGAIFGSKQAPYTYTEADWNDISEDVIAQMGKESPPVHIYLASKTASEKAFWKFRDENRSAMETVSFTAMNPVLVCGPPLVRPSSPEKINETARSIYTILSGQPHPLPVGGYNAFVDVRDVAALMVFGVQKPEVADGQRYIVCGGMGGAQATADILRKEYKDRDIVEGEPGKGYKLDWSSKEGDVVFDASKAVRDSGRQWIGFDRSVLDTAKSFEHLL